MEKKILYISLGVLLAITVLLGIYIRQIMIYGPEFECYLIHLDDNMKLWGTTDAVPDEAAAKKIADAIIGAQSGFSPDLIYDVKIDYDEMGNVWQIYYAPRSPDGGIVLGGEIMCNIRKDCAMVVGLGYLP